MDNSKILQDYFNNPDGVKLFRMIHQPTNGSMNAVVFLVHGLFEHCQAAYYESIINPLNGIGCMVITHDHIGHGLSGGARGMIYNFGNLVRDVLLDIDEVLEKNNIKENIPIFLYGHSMGGLASVHATLKRPNFFKGMCLEGPALTFPRKVSRVPIFVGKLISYLFPTLIIGKINIDDISRDLEYLEKVRSDELRIKTGISAKTGMEIYYAMDSLKGLMKNVDTPFFIGHGEEDQLCEIEGSKLLMNTSPISDKTLVSFPNAKHQLRMETENVAADFTKKVIEWIKSKITT